MYKLFSCCVIVKGNLRGAIIDLQRGKFYFYPNALLNEIKKNGIIPKSLIENHEYFLNDLLKKELAHNFGNMHRQFITLSDNYESPHLIQTIEIELSSNYDEKKINYLVETFEELSTSNIVLRLLDYDLTPLKLFIKNIASSLVRNIQLVIPDTLNINEILEICKLENRISAYYVTTDKKHKKTFKKYNTKIFYILNNEINQFQINPWGFTIDYYFYFKALKYNTFYFKRLYLDKNLNVFQSGIEGKSKGNFLYLKDHKKISSLYRSKIWNLNKDKIDVCSECEFRYVCNDKRIPVKRINSSWYHESECNYNPFIAKWKWEKGFQTLKECGVICDKKEYTIDAAKLKLLNNKLWKHH
jgi:hypothetical protein